MQNPVKIRQEKESDHTTVFELIKKAFENQVYSDEREQYLVNKLRQSEAFIPKLSLVAELENKIVGYILLTKIYIDSGHQQFESLALAPVAVLPDYHNKGIGSQLILESHQRARALGFQRIVLLGHPAYYPRFGYEPATKYNIKLPFEAPDENCMVYPLTPDGLKNLHGIVVYPKAFFDY